MSEFQNMRERGGRGRERKGEEDRVNVFPFGWSVFISIEPSSPSNNNNNQKVEEKTWVGERERSVPKGTHTKSVCASSQVGRGAGLASRISYLSWWPLGAFHSGNSMTGIEQCFLRPWKC